MLQLMIILIPTIENVTRHSNVCLTFNLSEDASHGVHVLQDVYVFCWAELDRQMDWYGHCLFKASLVDHWWTWSPECPIVAGAYGKVSSCGDMWSLLDMEVVLSKAWRYTSRLKSVDILGATLPMISDWIPRWIRIVSSMRMMCVALMRADILACMWIDAWWFWVDMMEIWGCCYYGQDWLIDWLE